MMLRSPACNAHYWRVPLVAPQVLRGRLSKRRRSLSHLQRQLVLGMLERGVFGPTDSYIRVQPVNCLSSEPFVPVLTSLSSTRPCDRHRSTAFS